MAHNAFRTFVLSDRFSCVAGKAAVVRNSYRFGFYDMLGGERATAGLARDLCAFVSEYATMDAPYKSFAALFAAPPVADELEFERLLWRQLQSLHEADRRYFEYAAGVSADPQSNTFAFSFAHTAFFVVGLHPRSERRSRALAFPALVFNAHEQFRSARDSGRFERIQRLVREREVRIAGFAQSQFSADGSGQRGAAVRGPHVTGKVEMSVSSASVRLEPQSGAAFAMARGQLLSIWAPSGAQVADVALFCAGDVRERFSAGCTIDYNERITLRCNDLLYSTRGTAIARIARDDVGVNDLLLAPCSEAMFARRGQYGHRSCAQNLLQNLARFGIEADGLTTLNVFMDVRVDAAGRITIGPPPCNPGDLFVLEALQPLIVGITACASELTNAGTCKPICYALEE